MTLNKLKEIIQIGLDSEQIVINYADKILTTCNPRIDTQLNQVPDPHPCSYDYKKFQLNKETHFMKIWPTELKDSHANQHLEIVKKI